MEKKSIYRQLNIEPLIVDILNFLDELDELTKDIKFEINENDKDVRSKILGILLEKHHKIKQMLYFIKESE